MAGWFDFVNGQTLPASRVQDYLMDQSVMVFANPSARTSALPTPSEGMVTYLSDVKKLFVYRNGAWVALLDYDTQRSANAIINGGFDIWQRGTSFTNSTSYTADRWFCSRDGSTTIDVTRQTFTPGAAPVAGYEAQYFMRIASTVVAGATFYASHKVEDVRSFAGQTVTLSYWAKANTTVANTPLYVQNFGTGGSSPVIVTSLATHSITTSWQRFSVTFTLGSIAGKTIGTNNCLELQVIRAATSATIDVWGVQLEAGSVATPFVRAGGTLQGELAACQRYYFRQDSSGIIMFGGGGCVTNTIADTVIRFPVTMRAQPSSMDSSNLEWWNYGNNTFYNTGTWTLSNSSNGAAQVRYTHGTGVFTTGQTGGIKTNGTGFIGFSAEL